MPQGKERRGFPPAHTSAGTIRAERYGLDNVLVGISVSAVPAITDLFGSVIGLPLSEGTVDAVLEEMAEKAGGAYREINRRIERSAVVGADETGCHVNGKKHWMYIWQNDGLLTRQYLFRHYC